MFHSLFQNHKMSLTDTIKQNINKIQGLIGAGDNFIQDILSALVYNPKNSNPHIIQIYYLYIQPFILLCFLFLQIKVIHLLWNTRFVQDFGLLTLFTSLEIFSFLVQNIFFIASFTSSKDYIMFEWCYAFKIATSSVPQFIMAITQWLRIGQSVQRFIIVYKPITFKTILNKTTVTVYLVVILLSALGIGAANFLNAVQFVKVYVKDRDTNEIVEACREVPVTNSVAYILTNVFSDVFIFVLPFVVMTATCVWTIILLRHQLLFRRKLKRRITGNDSPIDDLVKITIILTIVFALTCLPSTVAFSVERFYKPPLEILTIVSLVNSILTLISMMTVFICQLWMKASFRRIVARLFAVISFIKCACKNDTSMQI